MALLNSDYFKGLGWVACWRRYDLVEGSVSKRMGFGVSNAQGRPRVFLFFLPVDPAVEHSATCPVSGAFPGDNGPNL